MIHEQATSVVFLNRFYWPGRPATGQMLTDLAEDLAFLGWEVTVITGSTADADGRSGGPELRNGVKIVRVNSRGADHPHLVRRGIGQIRYMVGSALALLRSARSDVVVAGTDPPLIAVAALLIARLRGARLACWVQDFLPHQAARLGIVRDGGVVHRALGALAGAVYRRCDALVSPGERMTEMLVTAGASPDRVAWISNWVDTRWIRPVAAEASPIRAKHGLAGGFVVLCSAGPGTARTFTPTLDAAWLLRDEPDILFLFVGDGQKLSRPKAEAWRLGLDTVRFIDDGLQESYWDSLAAADVVLVTEHPGAAKLRVPSKTYRILASGRPLLFVGSAESETARIVTTNECGVVHQQGDANALAATILRLRDDRSEVVTLGARAREAAVTRFDRRIAANRWHSMLELIVDTAESRQPRYARPAVDLFPSDRRESKGTGQPALSGGAINR